PWWRSKARRNRRWSPNGWGGTTTHEMEAEAAGLQLGRVRPRRPARPHELGDAREGPAGRGRGKGGHHLLLLAAARLPRRAGAQPAPRAAAARRDLARWKTVLLPAAV